MTRKLLIIAVATLVCFCCSSLFAQLKTYDYSKMTDEDTEQLRSERHQFYAAKSNGKQDAIRQNMLLSSTRLDGNQADFDIRYYGLHVDLDFGLGQLFNSVDYKIQSTVPSLSAVDLNLTNALTVDSIFVEGAPALYSHVGDIIAVSLPTNYSMGEEFDMTVYYHGSPLYSGSQGMAFGSVIGNQMCWTNCEPYGSRNWWPCKDYPLDKPDSVDIWIEYPSTFDCMTAGAIISDVSIGGGRNLKHFKHNYPIATYLVAITCANFVTSTQIWNYDSYSMPVYSYTVPNVGAAKTAFETHARPVLTALSDRFGTYPYADEKAGNAHYGWGGAMEHQTCSFYNPTFYTDWVIAHETGHQWYGDMFTNATFNHIWIHEGFASYSEPLYVEDRFGFNSYKSYLQSQKYLGAGTIYVENLMTDDIFDGNLTYDKASWVVHMLRGVVGDDVFFNNILADWYNSEFAFTGVTTEDFSSVASAAVGEDIGWFFDQWIYGNGHPDYQYAFDCEPDGSGDYDVLLLLEQTQAGGTYFKMPINIIFNTTGGSIDTTIWNEALGVEIIELSFADSVTSLTFDPDEWILRTVTETTLQTTFVPSSLPEGYKDVPYYTELQAVGGVEPYQWTFQGGDLPFGTTFTGGTTGVIEGTPSFPAEYFFTIRVEDADSLTDDAHNVAMSVVINDEAPYLPGDADNNDQLSIGDAVYLINYIFANGPPPFPHFDAGDADCNGQLSIGDAVYIINYIFGGGPEPAQCGS